jgi:L-fuculose-phosphate aldolase
VERKLDISRQLVAVAQALDTAGLMPNKSGNVSCRCEDGFLITPAGVPYVELEPGRLAHVGWDAEPARSPVRPSSEWRMHRAVYLARPEVAAIVHTHSPRATALACAGRGIPAFHYMIALAGGEIRCMPYATFGTDELAANAVAGLEGRRAALLANHGVIAAGPTLAVARAVALEVENLADQYLALLAAGIAPVVLTPDELQRVLEKFVDYGRLG